MLVIRKIVPNPANRRIADRSVVARDSSWPDCQEPWKPASSRCRCAYRSSRMSRSMVVTALAMAQRRRKFSVAWATPRATAAAPSGSSRARSPWAIGPSIICLVSSGMRISVPTAANAAASMRASCQ